MWAAAPGFSIPQRMAIGGKWFSAGATGLGLACLLGAPLLAHAALAHPELGWPPHPALARAAGWLQAGAAFLLVLGGKWARPARWATALLASSLVLGLRAALGQMDEAGLLHAGVYAGLLILFARSLLPGHIPVITVQALKFRGGVMAPELMAYTRRVTWAWAIFCAAQIATSALLASFAAPQTWSWFINVLNLPLLLAMGAGEYAWRRIHHRGHAHMRPMDMLRAMRRPDLGPVKARPPGPSRRECR